MQSASSVFWLIHLLLSPPLLLSISYAGVEGGRKRLFCSGQQAVGGWRDKLTG